MFFSRIDSDVVLHWCSEYVIPKEGPGTARDEGGTAGADARSSEGAAGMTKRNPNHLSAQYDGA